MNSIQNDQQHQQENSGENDHDGSTQIAGSQSSFRPIVPGPSFPDQGRTPADLRRTLGPGWKKRVSTACLACKKSKRKVCLRLYFCCGVYLQLYMLSALGRLHAIIAALFTENVYSTSHSINGGV